MSSDIKFSIITVCLNSQKTIECTIQSVLHQTYQNFEYIIVDGKSTDETLDIIRRYKPMFKGKMNYVSEKDNGIYDAMNKGISLATGKLIGIVNSDDYYERDALENIASVYDGYQYSVIYGLLRVVKNNQEVMVFLKNHKLLGSAMITHPTCFVSIDVYRNYGNYSLEYKYSSDYEFMLRIHKKKNVRFYEVYKIISNFSPEGVSSSAQAYLETQKLLMNNRLISKSKYILVVLKTKVAILFRKVKRFYENNNKK